MICQDLNIRLCFNCMVHTEYNSTPETKEIACWLNVNKRQIDTYLSAEGCSINTALFKRLEMYKDHPLGISEYQEETWLRACVAHYFPEHIKTLEKMLVLI